MRIKLLPAVAARFLKHMFPDACSALLLSHAPLPRFSGIISQVNHLH